METKARTLVGLAAPTAPNAAQEVLGGLWARAGQEGVFAPDRPAWAAYFGYRPDGSYQSLVGRELREGESVPEGWHTLEVPAQKVVERVVPATVEAIQQTWGEIWSAWSDPAERAWGVDTEEWVGPMGEGTCTVRVSVR